MKVPFFNKVATRLLLFPLLSVLVLFAALCAGFYFLNPQNPFEDFHRQHLANLLSEKKLAVDMFFEQGQKSVEYLSNNNVVRDAFSAYSSPEPVVKKRKKADTSRVMAQTASQRFLDSYLPASPCRMFALISRNGKIIASSQRELIGSDWSDRSFLTNAIAELQSASVRISYDSGNGMAFLSPVFDDKRNLIGLIYAIPNTDKLSRLLRVEKAVYKTEKVEMIDREGNLIMTPKGFPDKKIKYNLPRKGKVNSVRLKDNLFFYAVDLESAPFRLVATVEKQEAIQPGTVVLVLGAIFAGFIVVLLVFQTTYSGPKLVSRPVTRLTNAARAVSDGNLDEVELGRDFNGELLGLKKTFEAMVNTLRDNEAANAEKLVQLEASMPSAPIANISSELRKPLYSITGAAEGLIQGEQQLSENRSDALHEVLCGSRSLLVLVDNLYDYAQLSQDNYACTTEQFNLCELVGEITSNVRELVGMREVEVVADCQEVFMDRKIRTDKTLLRKLLLNLLNNAVKNTGIGTITILCSEVLKDGMEYLEVSVADSGKGYRSDEMERLFDDIASPRSSLGLIVSRKIAEILGGQLDAESLDGKGSVFTAMIPIQAIVY